MGFWSALGNIGKIGLNLGTGGLSGLIPGLSPGGFGDSSGDGEQSTLDKILGAAGKVVGGLGQAAPALGGLEAGRQQGREAQTYAQQAQDRLAQQNYQNLVSAQNVGANQQLAGANLDLNHRQFALNAPQARASNSVRGDILANAQDFSYGAPTMVGNIPVPTSTGGLRPSIFSQNTRDLGGLMSQQALAGQQAGDTFKPLNFGPMPTAPTLTPLPEAGGLDKVLTTAGTIGALAPTFTDILKRYQAKGMTPPDEGTAPVFDPNFPYGG